MPLIAYTNRKNKIIPFNIKLKGLEINIDREACIQEGLIEKAPTLKAFSENKINSLTDLLGTKITIDNKQLTIDKDDKGYYVTELRNNQGLINYMNKVTIQNQMDKDYIERCNHPPKNADKALLGPWDPEFMEELYKLKKSILN